jgi:hemoglobin/transferrin/lactoferrin receptor protein
VKIKNKISFIKTFLLSCFLFSSSFVFSQKIKVVDASSKMAVENVFIYVKNFATLTDKKGEASLNEFTNSDTLIFQHPSYKTVFYTKTELQSMNNIVVLTESILKLDPLIISANKWEQNIKEVPFKISSISATEILFNNPQTSADLLEGTGEVYVQKSQLGGGSPMIRGFATSRILLVVDGVRINNAIFRSGNLQNVISIDALSTSEVEVIYGPGSVTYGSDAIGGVIDFHSLKPLFSSNKTPVYKANAFTRYSSANGENTGHLDFSLGYKKWAFVTSITHNSFNDLRMGRAGNESYVREEYVVRIDNKDSIVKNKNRNIQNPTAYSQNTLLQKIAFKPNKKWEFLYAFHGSWSSDVPRYDRLVQTSAGILKYAEWYYGPQEWMMQQLLVKHQAKTKLYDGYKINFAYQDYTESRHDRNFQGDFLRHRTENVKAFSLNVDFEKEINKKSSVFYGFESVYNLVFSKGETEMLSNNSIFDISSRYPNKSQYFNSAAYLKYNFQLSDKIISNVGVRYSYYALFSPFDDKRFFPFPYDEIKINDAALNGSLGLVYNSGKNFLIKTNIGTAYRAPNVDDIGKVFDSEPGNILVPNPNLKAEYAYNIDFGIEKTFVEKISFSLTCFYTYLDNAINRGESQFNGSDSIIYDGQMSKVVSLFNNDYAQIYGVQSSLLADIHPMFMFKSHLSYMQGRKQDGTPIRHVSPLFGSGSLIFKYHVFRLEFYVNYHGEISPEKLCTDEHEKDYMYAIDKEYAEEQSLLSPSERFNENGLYSPAWYTLNFRMGFNYKNTLRLNIGVENIGDVRYRTYSSGICAPGRNFIISLKASL